MSTHIVKIEPQSLVTLERGGEPPANRAIIGVLIYTAAGAGRTSVGLLQQGG